MYTPKTGLCLLGASISAIAAVGSVFELTSGNPEWGTLVTGSILVAAIPLTAFLFFTAVKSAS
jgi:F0F1-type ATP synthase membrane subunit c/vacuolar-type H+-ATPase subunit K